MYQLIIELWALGTLTQLLIKVHRFFMDNQTVILFHH